MKFQIKNKKDYICIIPARAGSKGIKNKNIKILGGKPLIYWTIKEALKIKNFLKVIVSTDSKKIKSLSEKYNAYCPFLRPKKFAKDKSHTIDAIKNVCNFLKKKNIDNYKYIVILQPTSPFRKKEDIQKSLIMFEKYKNASSLISVVRVLDNHPARMYYKNNEKLIKNLLSEKKTGDPRQNLKPMYLRNGSIYIIKKDNLSKNFLGKNPIGFEMSKDKSLNIDDSFDLKIARSLVKKSNL
ncbi:acylneuraminate cytidylyltransferase family protein [Candidatus Pelagibacter sp.]|nr:acylneuraminate cytidylyltransferase family protein [Candidatus Pelagibacter sp.]